MYRQRADGKRLNKRPCGKMGSADMVRGMEVVQRKRQKDVVKLRLYSGTLRLGLSRFGKEGNVVRLVWVARCECVGMRICSYSYSQQKKCSKKSVKVSAHGL